MNPGRLSVRPDVKYLVAAGLLGFILGAFVVASLGNVAAVHREALARSAKPLPAGALDDAESAVVEAATSTIGRGTTSTTDSARALEDRDLQMPVQGVTPNQLVDSFHDARDGTRQHEAIDILAPRGTPVLAVEDGTIARLFLSKAGGNTIYQFDPSQEYCYYYAHLDRYAPGISEHRAVKRGELLGYVGSTGNASPDAPHLHFAVFRLGPEKVWWKGDALNPYPLFTE
jgi:murein DD-endopeptidase MepM/ murein hydrolase activator NlpD